MLVVYRLRDDAAQVAGIQDASLNKPGFGFVPEPVLFGTPEWWAAIDSGELPVIEVRGTISRVYMGSMGDWPEFEAELSDGFVRSWTREGRNDAYVVGRPISVRMVRQHYKPDSYGAKTGGLERDVVIEILVDDRVT